MSSRSRAANHGHVHMTKTAFFHRESNELVEPVTCLGDLLGQVLKADAQTR